MRLFFITPKECKHISELMPGIFAVYQLEQEFSPYLTVEFIPNTTFATGVLLVVDGQVIRRNYTFDDPNDIKEMRKLLWKYVREIYNPTDITVTGEDGRVCLKNFIPGQTNKVIQGWANKLKSLEEGVCCKGTRVLDSKPIPIEQQLIKHPVYRYSNKDQIDRDICKKVRLQECSDNYPPNSATHDVCVKEVNWLCNNGYPTNKRTETILKYREKLKNEVLQYLKKNNMRVDKRMFDLIMSSGFYERPNNRMGNKAAINMIGNDSVADINAYDYNYYSQLIEGFNGRSIGFVQSLISLIIIIVIAFAIIR